MGVQKNHLTLLNNKKRFAKVKFYKFYRKDFWGYIRLRRLYSYKKLVYNILKTKKKFYNVILTQVFKGIKFFVKRLTYRGNLFIIKKRIQYFYYKLTDKQIGKLAIKFIRVRKNVINKFFTILECRLDVFLVRALYFLVVRNAYQYIINSKNIYVNNKCIFSPNYLVKVADIITLFIRPVGNPFFLKIPYVSIDIEKLFFRKSKIQKKLYLYGLAFCYYLLFYNKIYLKNFFTGKKLSFLNFLKFLKKCNLRKKLYFLRLFNFLVLKKFLNYNKILEFFLKYILINFFFIKKKFQKIRFSGLKKKKFFLKKKFIFIYKFLKNFFIFNNKNKYSKKYKIFYNFINLMARLNSFRSFFKIKRKTFYGFFFNRMKHFYNTKLNFKKFRFFKISKLLYIRLKLKKMFLYAGYPPYMEINFKLNKIIMIREPTILMIKYPFLVNNVLFFNYFKLKSYF